VGFLGAAHHQLGTPAVCRTAIARGDVAEIWLSLLRAVLVMRRPAGSGPAITPAPRLRVYLTTMIMNSCT
jgi:hypothetical protein